MRSEAISRARIVLVMASFLGLISAARGATLYVSNRGVDGPACGTAADRCRSISQAIANASSGDTIMVGPGRYGDLNDNGTLAETGEETPAFFCFCMISVNKPLIVLSSDGAAATMIDAKRVRVDTNVYINAEGEFGRPNHGFTVTQTSNDFGNGIQVHAFNVKIRGNQVLASPGGFQVVGNGISTVDSDVENILIESNQVIGWTRGISALGARKTVTKNQASGNGVGIHADGGSGVSGDTSLAGNVASSNSAGIEVSGAVSVLGNAVYGNRGDGIFVNTDFTGTIAKNNIFGNGASHFASTPNCGLKNLGVPVVAINNYWGAASGPGSDPADNVCTVGGTTATTPFSIKPFAVNPEFEP